MLLTASATKLVHTDFRASVFSPATPPHTHPRTHMHTPHRAATTSYPLLQGWAGQAAPPPPPPPRARTHTRTHTRARQRASYSRVAAFSGNTQQCSRSWLSYALHVVAGHCLAGSSGLGQRRLLRRQHTVSGVPPTSCPGSPAARTMGLVASWHAF